MRDQQKGAGPNELVIGPSVQPKGVTEVGFSGKSTAIVASHVSSERNLSTAIMERIPSKWPRPVWRPPWKNYRVISGHLGWVRSVAVDPSNTWFCTGSADRTIKIWDLASGRLKLTLTGHIEQIRGLAISNKHTYMFSAGDDKQVKCWDLEQNKVIRSYHGHLSGVYCLALHPTIDILLTGGRDSVRRVWDIRSKMQIHALSGHDNTVCSVFTRPTVIMEVCGSGTGGVVTISSKLKLLFSLDHWRVRLAFMLSPMILLVRGLLLAKQTRPLRCGKRTKLLPLKPFPFISSHLKISGVFRGTFSLVLIASSFMKTFNNRVVLFLMYLLVALLVESTPHLDTN